MSYHRNSLKHLLASILLCLALFSHPLAMAADDPLPSWHDGVAKQAILTFVNETTAKGSPSFIPAEDRIATFDQDGTLWVEQPIYTQMAYAFEDIKTLAPAHPEWRDKEPFKAILAGDKKAIADLNEHSIEEIIAVTHAGMSIDSFHQSVAQWLKTALHPRFKKLYTDLIYQPMLEVMQLLRTHGFKVYIVSGGGQEFIRAYGDKVYGTPPEQVIGTAGKIKYAYQDGKPALLKLPEILLIDNFAGKPETINLIIGKRPVAAFGNSDGDRQMLEWTQGGSGKRLELLVSHDDAAREYAYGADSKVGTFSDSLKAEAKKKGWIVVSMKNDWKVIFPK